MLARYCGSLVASRKLRDEEWWAGVMKGLEERYRERLLNVGGKEGHVAHLPQLTLTAGDGGESRRLIPNGNEAGNIPRSVEDPSPKDASEKLQGGILSLEGIPKDDVTPE